MAQLDVVTSSGYEPCTFARVQAPENAKARRGKMTGRKKKRFCPTSQFCTGRGQSLEGKDSGTMVGRKRGGLKIPTRIQKGRGPCHKRIHKIGGVQHFLSTGGRERMQKNLGIDHPRRCIEGYELSQKGGNRRLQRQKDADQWNQEK